MKNVMKTLVVVGAMVAAGSASANLADVRIRLGADFLQSWMEGNGNSTALSTRTVGGTATGFKNVLPKSYQGGALYLGAQWSENFGVEIGADMSARKKKDFTQAAATIGNGGVALSGTSKVRRTGYHFDLVGFYPIQEAIDLFASAGVGYVKAKLDVTPSATSAAIPGASNLFANTKSKGKSVFRLGVGASWQLDNNWGLRAKFGWEGTKRLRVNEPAVPGVSAATSSKAFKDTTSLSLGVAYRF